MKEAVDDSLGRRELLERLLSDEVERRVAKRLDLRARRANFEGEKRLDDINLRFNPRVPEATIVDLTTRGFVERRENALLIGPAGVGKDHFAQALGERACRVGHTTQFGSSHRMLTKLRAAEPPSRTPS
ncbi:MAG: ATP-binding protein [Planctomycetota bacterium JB042]